MRRIPSHTPGRGRQACPPLLALPDGDPGTGADRRGVSGRSSSRMEPSAVMALAAPILEQTYRYPFPSDARRRRAMDAGFGWRRPVGRSANPQFFRGRLAPAGRRRRPAADPRRCRPLAVPRAGRDAHADPRARRSRRDVRRRPAAVRGVLGLLQRLRPGRPRCPTRTTARRSGGARRTSTSDPRSEPPWPACRTGAGSGCRSVRPPSRSRRRRLRARAAGPAAVALAARLPRGPGDPGRAGAGGRARRRGRASLLPVDPEVAIEAAGLGRAGRPGPAHATTTIPARARSAWPVSPACACSIGSPATRRRCGSSPRPATAAPAGSSTFPALG